MAPVLRWPAIVSAVTLLLLALNLSCAPEAPTAALLPPEPSSHLLFLLDELHAEMPFYYRWMHRRAGRFAIRSRFTQPLVRRVIQREMEVWGRRRSAAAQLTAMHSNAWPVVAQLVEDLKRDQSAGVAAASILVRIDAERHPDWGRYLLQLRSRARPVAVFRYLLTGRDEFSEYYDSSHRGFALRGLAAVGTRAAPAMPDLIDLVNAEHDHELWPVAATTLQTIGAAPEGFVPGLCAYLLDGTYYPTMRASAARALARISPPSPDTLEALRTGQRDELGLIRVAAVAALWQLDTPLDTLLPTIRELLDHKLRTVRVTALELIADIGPPASPCREAVERLLSDENQVVREAAAAALRTMDGRPAPNEGRR